MKFLSYTLFYQKLNKLTDLFIPALGVGRVEAGGSGVESQL